ncbi:hypothetical protein HNR47_000587 [Methylopila jiangsuensis]|nr:hypothetical protein [Methylopila jiangsuensis]
MSAKATACIIAIWLAFWAPVVAVGLVKHSSCQHQSERRP